MSAIIDSEHVNGIDSSIKDHNDNDCEENCKGIPIKHQTKRSPEVHMGIDQPSPTAEHMKKFMKNSRRSRSRFGRGLAKKGNSFLFFFKF